MERVTSTKRSTAAPTAPAPEGGRRFKRVALILGQDLGYCRQVIRGVQAFAGERGNWIFRDAPPDLSLIPALAEWEPAGIIAHLFDPEVAKALMGLGKPIVNVTSTLDLKLPLVEVDHVAIGAMAAEHFLNSGFRNFGYFGSSVAGFSRDRERGFRQRLTSEGLRVSAQYAEYLPRPAPGSSWAEVDERIRQWLLDLPKPVAVLASNDVPARELAEMCRMLKLHVPEDVALLGVDDDEFECGLCFPPLSSIATPSERVGYEAARMLNELMEGRQVESPLFLPPKAVVVRQSSDIVAVDDPELSAVLRRIRQRAAENVGVGDIIADVGASRRNIERKFKRVMNRTILDEIRRVRVERAKRLLSTTELPMPAIARKCGFDSARRLAVVFREIAGTTPTSYRGQYRLKPSAVTP